LLKDSFSFSKRIINKAKTSRGKYKREIVVVKIPGYMSYRQLNRWFIRVNLSKSMSQMTRRGQIINNKPYYKMLKKIYMPSNPKMVSIIWHFTENFTSSNSW